jgi:hypothetical protein
VVFWTDPLPPNTPPPPPRLLHHCVAGMRALEACLRCWAGLRCSSVCTLTTQHHNNHLSLLSPLLSPPPPPPCSLPHMYAGTRGLSEVLGWTEEYNSLTCAHYASHCVDFVVCLPPPLTPLQVCGHRRPVRGVGLD